MESHCPPAHCCLAVVDLADYMAKDELARQVMSELVHCSTKLKSAENKLTTSVFSSQAFVSMIEVEKSKQEIGYDIIVKEHYTLVVPVEKQQGK
jgi:hypothetical protein